MGNSVGEARRQAESPDVAQARLESVRIAALATAVASLCGRWVAMAQRFPDGGLLLGLTALLLVSLLAYSLASQRPTAAALILAVAMSGFAFLLARVFAEPLAACLLAFPAILLGGLFGPLALILAAPLSAAVTLMAVAGTPGGGLAALSVFASIVATWVVMLPLHQRLGWAWRTSVQSIQLTEQLRHQKAKLGITVKALELSNHLLQRTNYELTVAEQEANEARASKEQFAATISHELRAPLNIILGFADIMHHSPEVYGDVAWTPTLRRDVAEIHRNARYLADFTNDIVDLAASEKPRLSLRCEITDLGELVEEVMPLARALLHDKAVTLNTSVPPNLPRLLLDRMRIRQVLLNLLTNAIRFTDSGEITVRLGQPQPAEVEILVRDTGPGIPPEELQAVFREFYQSDSHAGLKGQGKGLGLAIAKHLVQLHGGRIWAESQPGHGATFHVTLPVVARGLSRSVRTPLPAGQRPHGRGAVVVATEGRAVRSPDVLSEGWQVVQAASEEELALRVDEMHPDVLVLEGPDSGEGRAIARAFPSIPVLAWEYGGDGEVLKQASFREVLHKPVTAPQLLEALARALPEAHGRVLLIDDDRAFVQLVLRMLRAHEAPYQVRCAYTGAGGLERAREQAPDVVLLDLRLPDADGLDVARELRKIAGLAETPIILVTAALPPSDRAAAALHVYKGDGLSSQEIAQLMDGVLQVLHADYVHGVRQRSS
ncbi:MAG: response regulator [Anaerolineae bacterium]|nr:response regulator [Anaerolineae bacterium]